MLVEFANVTQEAPDRRRRWFQDEGMDLIVWYDRAGGITGFQICYLGADRQERALTWRTQSGFAHAFVDGGDSRPDKNMTPILRADGVVPWERLRTNFSERGAQLDAELREFVAGELQRGAARG